MSQKFQTFVSKIWKEGNRYIIAIPKGAVGATKSDRVYVIVIPVSKLHEVDVKIKEKR